MKHLYQKIYLTIIASLVALVLVASLCWKLFSDESRFEETLQIAREVAVALLPKPEEPVADQQKKLLGLSKRFRLELALYDGAGNQIAASHENLPAPRLKYRYRQRTFQHRHGAWITRLPDRRWLVARQKPHSGFGYGPLGFVLFLGGIALAIAVAVYPAVRGLTRRLERLQDGVETLGSGDLTTRVPVEGRDEVARLAESFNTAAERIEALMKSHKMFLANASHELRTPLSRLRVAVELLKDRADPKHKASLETDIAELDSMIDEILLASRLNTLEELETVEEIDLLALAAEEAARYPGVDLNGSHAIVRGDPRLVRRLIRNLLENAKRYGQPPVTVEIGLSENNAVLKVCDAGTGIARSEFEKIFEPFYRPEGTRGASGTGLGLSLVRQISRRHGGDAVLTHTDAGTTCFQVTLPRVV